MSWSSRRGVVCIGWSAALGLGLLQVFAWRNAMSPDGVQYLDLGANFWAADWSAIGNGYWSPLYGILVALPLELLAPSPYWEPPLVHALGFLLFLFALYAGHRLLAAIFDMPPQAGLPDVEWLRWALGYSALLLGLLRFISLKEVTPDTLMVAFLLLALEQIVRLEHDRDSLRRWLLAGMFLGVGYWAKLVMFPLGLVVLAGACVARGSLRRAALAAVVFVAVSAPLVAALSLSAGRLSFGDSGRLNYLWFTNRLRPIYYHWQGDEVFGRPLHPTRQIHLQPALFEFEQPFLVTHPPTYGFAYWHQGAQPRWSLADLVRTIADDLPRLYPLFVAEGSLLLAVLLALGLPRRGRWIEEARRGAPFILPALAACGGYLLTFATVRTLTPAWLLLLLGMLSSGRRSEPALPAATFSALTLCVAAVCALQIAWPLEQPLRAELRASLAGDDAENDQPHWKTAQALAQLGMQPGDPLAVVGSGSDDFWAWLGRFRIVAEGYTDGEQPFWQASPSERRSAIEAYGRSSARILVARDPPPQAADEGWRRLGSTQYWFLALGRIPAAAAPPVASARPSAPVE